MDGIREHQSFQIGSNPAKIRDGLVMIDWGGGLCDDRTFVEGGRHVMGRGTHQFHAASVRLSVGVGSGERRQEGVMHVDHATGPARRDVLGKNPHVSSKNHQIRIQPVECIGDLSGLSIRMVGVDGKMLEGNAMVAGRSSGILMIGDHRNDLAVEIAICNPIEKIDQAMETPAGEDDDSSRSIRIDESPLHGVGFGDW